MKSIEESGERAAISLLKAYQETSPLNHGDAFDGYGLEEGYSIQKQLIELQALSGNLVGGWKAAMSNKPAMERFGLEKPVYGPLFNSMLLRTGLLRRPLVIAPKIEAEVAFVLGRDLSGPEISDDEIIQAIAFVAPAIEVADSRFANWQFNIGSFVADCAVSAFYKIGELQPYSKELDLDTIDCQFQCGDTLLTGDPGNVMGGPLHSFIQMVRFVIGHCSDVSKGQHFISGSLTRPIDMVCGQHYKLTMFGTEVSLAYDE